MGIHEITGGNTKPMNHNWIAFIGKAESLKVQHCDVLYIEQIGKVLHIQKDSGLIRMPGQLKKFSNEVGTPFFLAHSYLLVNFSRVFLMSKSEILFDDLTKKQLSKNTYARTRKQFNEYLAGEKQDN